MLRDDDADDARFFNRPGSATMLPGLSESTQTCWYIASFFEKIQNRIDLAVWDNWHHLLTFIGDPASRPPPIGSGYIIA